MPSSPETLDERFEELTALVRASRPRAPEALRERVQAMAEAESAVAEAPRRGRAPFRLRRAALVLVPALLVGLAAGAAVVELRGSTDASRDAGATIVQPLAPVPNVDQEAGSATFDALRSSPQVSAAPSQTESARVTSPLPPSRNRIQEYHATLRVHVPTVKRLSSATSAAMRITRSLGGYIVTANTSTPGDGEGASVLVVRVPVGHVQDAIMRFSQLGAIVSQSIRINDLQQTVNKQGDQIANLRGTIRKLREQLEDPTLTEERRVRVEDQLKNARRELTRMTQERAATERRGNLSRIALTLTTREQSAPVVPGKPGTIERIFDDAVDVLERAFAWTLAVLVVAGPFLLLLALIVWVARRGRRAADRKLLERTG